MTGKNYFTRALDFLGRVVIVSPSCIPAGRQAEGCGRRARFPATPTRGHRLGRRAEVSGLSPGMGQNMVEESRPGPLVSIPRPGLASLDGEALNQPKSSAAPRCRLRKRLFERYWRVKLLFSRGERSLPVSQR